MNRGQTDGSVDFVARCGTYMAWIRPCGVVLSLSAPDVGDPVSRRFAQRETAAPSVMDVRLVGSTPCAPRAGEVLPGASNYMIGRDESRWVIGVPHVRTARYDDSWPGVGVVWSMDARRLHVEFDVAAGADPDLIALAFDRAAGVAVDRDGSLRIASTHGDAAFSAPIAFQPGGRRVDVKWRV